SSAAPLVDQLSDPLPGTVLDLGPEPAPLDAGVAEAKRFLFLPLLQHLAQSLLHQLAKRDVIASGDRLGLGEQGGSYLDGRLHMGNHNMLPIEANGHLRPPAPACRADPPPAPARAGARRVGASRR